MEHYSGFVVSFETWSPLNLYLQKYADPMILNLDPSGMFSNFFFLIDNFVWYNKSAKQKRYFMSQIHKFYVDQAYSVIFRVVKKEVSAGFCSGENKFFVILIISLLFLKERIAYVTLYRTCKGIVSKN